MQLMKIWEMQWVNLQLMKLGTCSRLKPEPAMDVEVIVEDTWEAMVHLNDNALAVENTVVDERTNDREHVVPFAENVSCSRTCYFSR